MPHLIEFLIADIHPFVAVGPVPEDLVTLIRFPFFQAQFAIGAVAFLRQPGLEKSLVGRTDRGQLVERVPIIIVHLRRTLISEPAVAMTNRSVVRMMMIGKLGMPEDQGDQIGHLTTPHLSLPPIEQGWIAGIEHRLENRFKGVGTAVA